VTTATTKIVIVAGQEFGIPVETDNEAIRAQLLAMGFADVAKPAEIKVGTREVDGQTVQTVEFIKKAGTKGLGGADLAQLLAELPRSSLGPLMGITSAQLLGRLFDEQMTVGELLASEGALRHALHESAGGYRRQSEGAAVCARVDHAPAAPCATPLGW